MHKSTWKKFESRVAAILGCRRAVLSGSANRDDLGSSDSTHPRLFVECKMRESHSVRTLHDKTLRLAAAEGKIPVLAIGDTGKVGFLWVVHSGLLDGFIAEYIAGMGDEDRDAIEGLIRTAYNRRHEGGE